MATRRQDIIAELISRVSAITKTNGFSTNAGRNVYVGEIVKLGENEPDSAIAIVIGNETVDRPAGQGDLRSWISRFRRWSRLSWTSRGHWPRS